MANEEKNSFILLWRSARKHPWFKDKPAWVRLMWIDLLIDASWKTHTVSWHDEIVVLKRGQYIITERTMAQDYGVSRRSVRYYLDKIEAEGMIKRQKLRTTVGSTLCTTGTLVTICNYDKFQPDLSELGPGIGPGVGPYTEKGNIQKKGFTEKGSLDLRGDNLKKIIDKASSSLP